MEKILVIIKREYLQRVRTRAFLIGTILTPALLLVFSLLPVLVASRESGPRKIAVLDQTGDSGLFDSIKDKLKTEKMGGSITLTRIVAPAGEDFNRLKTRQDINEVMSRLDSEHPADGYSGYLILRSGILDKTPPQYLSENPSDFTTTGALTESINSALVKQRLVQARVVGVNFDDLMAHVDLETKKIGTEGVTEEKGQTFGLAFVMLFFIYMTILMYGISTMRGVIEEKQSRIVEVVISSIKPFNMLMGKLIGIGLVGLTQYLIWVVTAVAFTILGVSVAARMNFSMPGIPPMLLVYFVLFFVLGYFLFATLYALVGSMVSSEDEAQQLQFPVTMLIVAPMTIFWVIVREPNSPLATVISMVPFFAPTLMLMRIAMVSPPLWQVLLSIFLMIAAIVLVVWVASKIYRITILMYGKKPTLAELGRWLRYA
jgi:ABC-2 type transport system permease protein